MDRILWGLCNTHHPTIIFLVETKNKISKLDGIRRRLNFPNKCYVDSVETFGGLALWWIAEVNLQVKYRFVNIFRCIISNRAMSDIFWCIISNGAMSEDWLATLCTPLPDGKKGIFFGIIFWKLLLRIGTLDFVLEILMRLGCHGKSKEEWPIITPFQHLLSDCEFIDLEFKGAPYTWTNNQSGSFHIRERLDKAVATVGYCLLFPYAQFHHEALVAWNHYPLVLHCMVLPKKV